MVKYTIWYHSIDAVEVNAPTMAIDAVVVIPCVLPISANMRSFSNILKKKMKIDYKNL